MMKIPKDWWKYFFNDIYLITDSRTVCNEPLTHAEVDLLEDVLRPAKDDRILDLCGGHGRHSLELARRGYNDLTVLDFSDYLLRLGRKTAKKHGLKIRFCRGDARGNELESNAYSVIMILANSFGYFPDEKDNMKILRESYRLLRKGGKLLLDLADPAYVKRHLKPTSWHEANRDTIVCRERSVRRDMICAREIVVSKKKGLLRDGYYCEHVYDRKRIASLLNSAGFAGLSVKRNASLRKGGKDYGLMTSRMFVTAVKG
jgi:D-alanine-D-alanine ligase